MVFLMETKLRQNKMEVIKLKAGFDNVFTVDCVGRSGGLALLWKNEAGYYSKLQSPPYQHNSVAFERGSGLEIYRILWSSGSE
jgi:hypothetical protein